MNERYVVEENRLRDERVGSEELEGQANPGTGVCGQSVILGLLLNVCRERRKWCDLDCFDEVMERTECDYRPGKQRKYIDTCVITLG